MARFSPPTSLSVVVCTYNRADSLLGTLRALSHLTVPFGLSWEIIVVDNNSSDDTADKVNAYQLSLPQLRYVFEGRQGLSYARNAGISNANGDIIFFTDDDVLPEADWIPRVLAGLSKYDAIASGGYISPLWETPPPSWLTERLYGFLAIKTDECERLVYAEEDFPFGANMAFRREAFSRFGLFDPELGRKGSVLAGCEEYDVFSRLIEADERIVYLPTARVRHRVESFRTKKTYFRRWRLHNSRNLAETQGLPGNRRVVGIPLYLFGQFWRALKGAVMAQLQLPEDEALLKELVVWHFVGTVQGLWRTRRLHRIAPVAERERD